MTFKTETEVFKAQAWDDPDRELVLAIVSDGKGRKFVGSWPADMGYEHAKRYAIEQAMERLAQSGTSA